MTGSAPALRPSARAAGRRAFLRADASLSIGTGHVARCTTLGAALVARGWHVALATRDLPEGLRPRVEGTGIAIVDLPAELPAEREVEVLDLGQGRLPDLIVADGYGIGPRWLATARSIAAVTMAIDDLADRPQPVDVLLNQNLGAKEDRYRPLVPEDAVLLLGPSYALLRPAFAAARGGRTSRSGAIERVLVFISGADSADVTRRAAEGVVRAGLSADVVVGATYPHLDGLRSWAREQPAIDLHVDTPDMAGLMARADVAVGAPSSASWERCCLGLPAVLVTLADNQAEVGRLLAEVGAARLLGWHTGVGAAEIAAALVALRADPPLVRRMSAAAAAITDGRGTERVVTALEARLAVER